MDFVAVLDQVIALLRQRGRMTYRTLQIQFTLDDAQLAALKDELLYSQPHVVDDAGRGLVWTEDTSVTPVRSPSPPPSSLPASQPAQPAQGMQSSAGLATPEAERRQLTVLFCDLVDSTPLASQLDPEDLREVVRAYQDTCAKVIARFEGHIAQYLGDGLLVYFGYPLAHEDDAQRAVRAGLGIVEALGPLNTRLTQDHGVHVAVRLGIHTGLVVVGEVGGSTRQEQLALGETPNLAARLQGSATPNTLVISAATYQLLGGFFACQSLGTQLLRGLPQPLEVYQVLYENMARSRLEAASSTGLTPLVGREQEVALLLERWTQVKDGLGQVVLLSGEAGIGKSRLVQVLTAHVAAEPQAWLTPCQCSPYYQNTALYPMMDLLERVVLRFGREEDPPHKLSKLEGFLVQYGLPLADVVPLFAALLSLPLPADYAPLTLSPEQQKQQTLQAPDSSWVGTRRVALPYVSSCPPLKTVRTTFMVYGLAPAVSLRARTKRSFPFRQLHSAFPVDSLRVRWVPLVRAFRRLGAFAMSPPPRVDSFPVLRLLRPIRHFLRHRGFVGVSLTYFPLPFTSFKKLPVFTVEDSNRML